MGSGAGKPVVSPSATPAYTFCYTGAAGPSSSGSPQGAGGDTLGVGVQAGSSTHLGGDSNSTSRPSSQQSNYGEAVDENCNMVCEACAASFSIFKRKYRCSDCDKYYCSNCFIKEPRKCCSVCSAIQHSPTRAELMNLKIKDLRLYLNTHSISTQSCREKDDLVDLVIQYVQTHPHPQPRGNGGNVGRGTRASASTSSASRTNSARPGSRASHPQAQPQQQPGQRTTQRFEEIFNDLFSRFQTQGTGSSVDPPDFNIFSTTSRNSPGEGFTGTTFNSTNTPSGSDQRPQSRTAWTSGTQAAPDTATTAAQENVPLQEQNDASPTQDTEQTPVQPMRRRASLSDVDTVEGIESLSIKQLKEILTANFVDYKGCVERYELLDRVKRLYEERQQRKKKEDKAKDGGTGKEGEEGALLDEDESTLCKICMDAEIDCVLLECGHMVTCTNCGKRMNECPICRQYVVRAVHIFRA